MKLLALNGSPKHNGNTFSALKTVMAEIEKEGIETELIHIGNRRFSGCMACGKCRQNGLGKCVIEDGLNEILEKMKAADALLIGSPVYYAGINGTLKSFLDRAFFSGGTGERPFRHKVGAAVVAVRRAGALPAYEQINKYFAITEMLTAHSCYWNMVYGCAPGESDNDEEGVNIMRVLGQNTAWLMKLIESGKGRVKEPVRE